MEFDLDTAMKVVRELTPITPLTWIPDLNLWIKDERGHPAGSFKVRGAAVWLAKTPNQNTIITASSGNHARALRWLLTATQDPRSLVVVVTSSADPEKVQELTDSGCEVIVCHGDNEKRDALARDIAASTGASFCSSHDDLHIIAGQATIGMEILAERPGTSTIFVPVGGGGLYAGTLIANAHEGASTQVVGVEPVGANAMSRSLSAGSRQLLKHVDTRCDALRASAPGIECLRLAQRYNGQMTQVSDGDILDTQRLLQDRIGPVELSAAAAAAGALRTGLPAAVCVLTAGAPPRSPRR